jgi:hypothetical protein
MSEGIIIPRLMFRTCFGEIVRGQAMAYSKIKLDANLAIYLGGGCNSIVLTSKDGKEALIVGTKWFRSAKKHRA